MNLDNIIGVEEAAELLGLSPGTIKNMCADGKLRARKIGKTWIMDKTNLEVREMENLKVNGLEQARRDFNKWQGHACIMVDFSDMTAWCDVFASGQEWTEYNSNDIIKAVKKVSMQDRDNKVSKGKLNDLVNDLYTGYQKGHRSAELNDYGYYSREDIFKW